MEILQVKQYNNNVAEQKWQKCDKARCIPSMFFFYLDNDYTRRNGFNIARKKGYIAFDENKAIFGVNEEKAIQQFNKY